MAIEVWDDDDGKLVGQLDDLVHKYSLNIKQPADPLRDSAHLHSYTLCGQQSRLSMKVRIYCDTTYLMPDCRVSCVARDDELGHYTCNYAEG